jgi:ribosomal protein S18 acetylase RimI-like enzyme
MAIINVRPAVKADIPGIRQLAQTVLTAQHSTDRAQRLLERIYSTDSLTRTLQSDGVVLLVAESGTEIVGVCKYGSPLMDDCEDRKEIHRLFVHPDYTDSGIERQFLSAIEADLRDEVDVQRISVYIQPDNEAMYDFYVDNGFHHEMVEDKDGEWYMEKTL